MNFLVSDEKNNTVSLYNDSKLTGWQVESNFSTSNKFPVYSIKALLDNFDLDFSKIDNFIYIGENKQKYNALLNLELLDLYDHVNRKEFVEYSLDIAEITSYINKSGITQGIAVKWDNDGIKTWQISRGNLSPTTFSADENNAILKFTRIITEFTGQQNFYNKMLFSCFQRNMDLYNEVKNLFFHFRDDGRIEIKHEEFRNFLKKYTPEGDILYALKKIIDDILIHSANYYQYITREENCILTGSFCIIALANRKMEKFLPFKKYFFNLFPSHKFISEGAVLRFLKELDEKSDEETERKRIEIIINNLFKDFHSENIEKISKYFYYMDDELLLKIQDYLEKCEDIKINFVLKDIIISSSGMKSWAFFYFYFFGKYKKSGHNVILNYKSMMFLKKENNEWNIEDIEFYHFENLPILTIELSNCCNFKCIMCDTHIQKNKSFMSLKTFKNIIDSLKDFKISTITPFWVGEPLLNPDFNKMLDYAFEKNINNELFTGFTINTNGSMLDSKKIDCILKNSTRPDMNANTFIRIHFSVDAYNKETFKTIHQADMLEKVNQNIENFLAERRRKNAPYPKVTVALIVMKENFDEIKDFVNYWSDILKKYSEDFYLTYDWPYLDKDAIYIRRLDCAEQNEAEKLHYDAAVSLGLIKVETSNEAETENNNHRIINTDSVLIKENLDYYIRRPCPALWKTPIINWNGEVTVCCFDIDLKLKLGNINNQSLDALWNSPLIDKWRINHIRGDFQKIERCRECHNINSPVMRNSEYIEYLVKNSKKDEVEKAHFIT